MATPVLRYIALAEDQTSPTAGKAQSARVLDTIEEQSQVVAQSSVTRADSLVLVVLAVVLVVLIVGTSGYCPAPWISTRDQV